MRGPVVLSIWLGVGACAGPAAVVLPAVPSAPPVPPPESAPTAGFGRADITPPPGLGLAGYGPEGRVAVGYRHRLFARAMVLEDARGEMVAFATVDLPFVSLLLHRRAAAQIADSTPIGADRFVLAATHTHSGPGQFMDVRAYNERTSSARGYDPALADFLSARIAAAVIRAYRDRRPARVRWGAAAVWGFTRNRSLAAHARNGGVDLAPSGLDPAHAAVDPGLTMIRVDLADRADPSRFVPAGALTIFAIHGTGNSPEGDLYDGDVHALVERSLERHVDSLTGASPDSGGAVHLVANGAVGDVSPDWSPASRCPPPRLRPMRRLGGARAPLEWEWRGPSAAARDRCVRAGRESVGRIGDALGRHAIALFDSLAHTPTAHPLWVSRAFRTVPLVGSGAPPELCPRALAGGATFAGAEDGPTRYRRWRWVGIFPSRFEEGPRSTRSPSGCHAEKRPAASGAFARLLFGPHPAPEAAQLAVVRVSDLLLVVVPAELTTAAGRELTLATRRAADEAGGGVTGVAVIGLANGYIQYVATEAEYAVQHYEGASTIYGPGTLRALTRQAAALAALVAGPARASPDAEAPALTVYPGRPHRRFPRAPAPRDPIERRLLAFECFRDSVAVEWRDAALGALLPSDQPLLRFDSIEGDTSRPVVWDDDRDVEARYLGPSSRAAGRWRVRWTPPAPGRYRLVLLPRPGLPELRSEVCAIPER